MKKIEYKFSIIMSIYNVENYLVEAIDSVIGQDINFKKNVQLILVNDGSIDNSEEICLKYKKSYPSNITYVKKKNGGLSSARNVGLKYVQGELVNFFDPDDILTKNVLSEVYKFYKRNQLCIDMVCIPLVFFEAAQGLHGKYKYLGTENRIVNILEEPYNFILSSASTFYKSELITKKYYDESLQNGEDVKMNISFYDKNPYFGYVCENDVTYYYRKRLSENSIVDTAKKEIAVAASVIDCLDEIDLNHILSYHKEIILYQLCSALKLIKRFYKDNKESYHLLLEKTKKYLNFISVHDILTSRIDNVTSEMKIILLYLKGEKPSDLFANKALNINFIINIKNYYIKDNCLYIELLFNNYDYDYLDVVAFDGNNCIYNAVDSKDINSSFDLIYGDILIDRTHYRKFCFDLRKNKIIKFIVIDRKNNNFYPTSKFIVDKYTKLALRNPKLGLRYKNKKVSLSGKKFKISTYTKKGFYYNLISFLEILKTYHFFALVRLLNRRKKKFILISDRPYIARDNGEALFKYIYKNEPNIAKNTYFVIDGKSPDYKRLKKIGKVVKTCSFKHKFLFLNSKYIYSSHNARIFYTAFKMDNLKYYSDMFNYQFIWLQHGIIMNDVCEGANRLLTKNDKMIVSTSNEYNEISKDKYFFDRNNIVLSGLARYDLLTDDPQKIITICPTWRQHLSGKILSSGLHETVPHFEKTSYYKIYKDLLTNKKLIKLLKSHDYKLNFVLHSGMLGYKEFFDEFSNENIYIISQNEINYNMTFKESKLLITDYSSVLFDFAYLKKPEIYFQFDKEQFFSTHYKKGYFSYDKDGFGDVLETVDDVVNKIEYYFKNDFKMEKKYVDRVDKTFEYNDKNNCKRIISATYYNGGKK